MTLWVSKGLIKHFISYFLNYICVCIYISNVTCHVFFCLLFFPDLFLLYPNELKDSFEITLYLYRITHFQLIHSPVFRDDDETHSYCIDERVQKLKLAACLHFSLLICRLFSSLNMLWIDCKFNYMFLDRWSPPLHGDMFKKLKTPLLIADMLTPLPPRGLCAVAILSHFKYS